MSAPALIHWMAAHFSPEQYLFWTRWQCLLWTLADLCIIFHAIRLSNLARMALGRRPHRYAYAVLLFTVLLVPFIPLAPGGGLLFVVELGITVPHFLLLCHVLTANIRVYAEYLHHLLSAGARNHRPA